MALQYYGGQVPLLNPSLHSPPFHDRPAGLSTLSSSHTPSALEEQLPPSLAPETDDASHTSDGQPSKNQKGTPASISRISQEEVDTFVANALSAEGQMKQAKTKATIGVLSGLIAYVSLNSLAKSLQPNLFVWSSEDREQDTWISTSQSWFDQKACRWLGLCGLAHYRAARHPHGLRPKLQEQVPINDGDSDQGWQDAWSEGREDPANWTSDGRILREIPPYVFEYAPLVHLFSGEQYWPCDIAEHLYHITPMLNYTPVQSSWQHPKLKDLDGLNRWERGRHVFLTSNDDVEQRPEWLEGVKNIPRVDPDVPDDDDDDEAWPEWDSRVDGDIPDEDESGRDSWLDVGQGSTRDRGGDRPVGDSEALIPGETAEGEDFLDNLSDHDELKKPRTTLKKRTVGGRSDAPAVLIVVDKGHGIVDAFWFFFYSFNLGNTVFNVRFGNHVGDWEHTMIRFKDGNPKAVFFSEHSFGDAYDYAAVEKIGVRPVVYSATGSHAMYATPGPHPYILPLGILHDETDRGPLWDPALNSHSYTYDYIKDELRSSNYTPKAPTQWFYFNGHWGDKFYPLGDERQYRFAGQYHYVNGPIGPRFKNLGRRKMCQGRATDPCHVKSFLGGSMRPKRWQGPGVGDELTDEDLELFFGNETKSAMR